MSTIIFWCHHWFLTINATSISGIIEKKKQPKFSEFLRHRRKTRNSKDRDAFLPEQFELKKRSIPWKAITYAVILFVVGTALLVAGSLIHIGHVDNEVNYILYFPLILKTYFYSNLFMAPMKKYDWLNYFFRNTVTDYGLWWFLELLCSFLVHIMSTWLWTLFLEHQDIPLMTYQSLTK